MSGGEWPVDIDARTKWPVAQLRVADCERPLAVCRVRCPDLRDRRYGVQDTRKPLRLWLHAMWWVTGQKTGASALGLQRLLGLGSYETAWAWRHKLRRAMVRPGRDRLSGRVEVDESFVGGRGGAQGRSTATKALIVVAAEEVGLGIGRIRMRRVPDAAADSLQAFVTAAVEPGSVVP